MCRPSGGDHNVFRRGFERDQIEPIGVDGRCVVREDSSSLWMINAEKRACSFRQAHPQASHKPASSEMILVMPLVCSLRIGK
jgi:hypothetical protein